MNLTNYQKEFLRSHIQQILFDHKERLIDLISSCNMLKSSGLAYERNRAEFTVKDFVVLISEQQKDIEQIPIEGRDITRVLYRLPNVSQATGF